MKIDLGQRYVLAVALLIFSALGLSDASALVDDKKVALVIGNSAYIHAVTLSNPVNDGRLMAQTLRSAGFTVIEGEDLNKVDMRKLLDQFTEAAVNAEVGLVYYAGHGLQVDGSNYLIPVDAKLENSAQLQTRTISVEDVLRALPPDPAVGIVILDACRDNPLARTLAAALPKSRSISSGLAAVQASGLSHDSGGLLIAYATDPGAVAYDGKDVDSPYTTALAKHITTPGVEIQSALTRVRADVTAATNRQQRPWSNASLGREVFLGGPPPAEPASSLVPGSAEPPGSDVNWTVEQMLWDEASKRNSMAHYKLYLSKYPDGHFADIAALNIQQLQEEASKTANVPRSEDAVQAQDRADQLGTAPAESRDRNDPKADSGKVEVAATVVEEPAAAVVPAATVPELPVGPDIRVSVPPASPNESGQLTLAARDVVGPAPAADDIGGTSGNSYTEAKLNLNRDARIDLQLRLRALGYSVGRIDGSLGPASRSAIGAWQVGKGFAETGFLNEQQYFALSVQTDPLIAQQRAEYEAEKAPKSVPAPQRTNRSQQTIKATSKAIKKGAPAVAEAVKKPAPAVAEAQRPKPVGKPVGSSAKKPPAYCNSNGGYGCD